MSKTNIFEINKDDFNGIDIKKIMQDIEEKASELPEPDFSALFSIDDQVFQTVQEKLEDLRNSSYVTTQLISPTGNVFVKFIKRFFRKMTFWYVEPSILAHSNFNTKVVDLLETYEMDFAELKEELYQLKHKENITAGE